MKLKPTYTLEDMRQFWKMLKKDSTPKKYGEYLQKKKHRK